MLRDQIKVQKIELRQIRRYYLLGMWGYALCCGLIAWMIYAFTQNSKSLIWFGMVLAVSIFNTLAFLYETKRRPLKPKRLIRLVMALLVLNSSVYSYLLFTFIPNGSPETVMLLVIVTTSLAAGSMALAAYSVRGFIAGCYPSMIMLSYALFLQSEAVYQWLSMSMLMILLGLTWFSRALSQTILRTSDLGYQNKSLIRELRTALIQTDESNRAKSVFLASASHDLRQPLHALGLLTETLGSTPMNSQQTELHEHMMSAVDSTRGMLDSLLNISKLDAGAISAQPKPFLVQSVFKKLESELAPIADEYSLIYRSRDTIAAANSDAQIVELILRNLISNAIRYSDDGGLLVACRNRAPNRLVIEVWDTGIGVQENKIEEIFSEFKQLHNPERDSQKGFGLGLAIAQGLAKTINSNITVQSKLGRGSVFRFELNASDAQVIEDIPENSAPINFSGQSVVVIDDDSRVRASMKNLMLSWGCECVSVEDSIEGIQKLGSKRPDILLVDYRLRNGKTGREAIDEMRSHYQQNIPAIIITGDTGTHRIKDAQAVDALLLHKPASTKQLQRMMRKLLD
jgi:signal transduction histidine kinase/CheY-like chemotaxis protein